MTHLQTITPRPLTGDEFAPYGQVIEHAGTNRRHYLDSAFIHSARVNETKLWVSRLEAAAPQSLRIQALERHIHSSQSFIPLTQTPYLVLVAPSQDNGRPDTAGLKAFIASPNQGVCYAKGVWHHGLAVLKAPAEFAIFMGVTGQGDDDEFLSLDESEQALIDLSALAGAIHE